MKEGKKELVKLEEIKVNYAVIKIEGDTDLVLNKMNARNERKLMADDRKKVNEQPNRWEDIITAIHWRDPLHCTDTYTQCDEAMMNELLENNAPCVSAFGMKKAICQAVTRNEIDKWSTKIDNAISIISPSGLIPITFAQWTVEDKLISPKKGSPVKVLLNKFSGWSAEFRIAYTDHVYNLNQIVNIINLAGFGLGIGSGRSSGYGRYHVVAVTAEVVE